MAALSSIAMQNVSGDVLRVTSDPGFKRMIGGIAALCVFTQYQTDFYWRFNNYVASYELKEFKDLSKPQNKHHKKSCIISFSMERNNLFIG